jgi:Spy/CpxP family protein refolding chaperone
MNNEIKNKWQIRVATFVIFMLGFVAGALALNVYHVWVSASGEMVKQKRYDQIFNQLNLTDQQRGDVQKIVGETREQLQNLRKESEPRVQEIRGRADNKFQQILTPEQWRDFQQLRDKMRASEKTPN